MESRNLLSGIFFMNLLREDAGVSSIQFAVFSALLVFLYLLVLLALRFIN